MIKKRTMNPSTRIALLISMFLFISILSYSNVNANPYYDNSVYGNNGQLKTSLSINYSNINTNNSQFLRGLSPTQVANLFSSPWLYNQSLGFYNWLSGFLFDYNMTTPAITYANANFWNVSGNQNGLTGTKSGSYNINTTGNVTGKNLLINGDGTTTGGLTSTGVVNVSGVTGTTGNIGSIVSITAGNGGDNPSGTGGRGGSITLITGNSGSTGSGSPNNAGVFTVNTGTGGAPTGTGSSANGGNVQFTLGNGGSIARTSSSQLTGGNGGSSTILTGTGGLSANSGSGLSRGGNGGDNNINTGAGASINSLSSASNVGGNGGGVNINSGTGGSATRGTANTGGNGGDVTVTANLGGTGATANGVNGNILFKSGNTEIARFDNTAGAVGYFWLPANNQKFQLGSSKQSSIYYNGSDLLINPKETGSGKLWVLSGVDTSTNFSVNNVQGITKNIQIVTVAYPLGCWTNYTGGILTWSNC